ncbi:MAG: cytochrome c oxidase subunit II [Pseudomonadota bacterium]|nr:cytochrome c oxidase subunit II [Pseudomonadota bacterium]
MPDLPEAWAGIPAPVVRFSFETAEGVQSALDTAGGAAQSIERLGLVLLIGASVIFLFVIGLLLYGVLSAPKRVAKRRWVIGGGLIFPVAVLSVLLAYTLFISNELTSPPPAGSPDIRIVGKRWWWEVRYRQPNGMGEIVLANELHLPVGRPVEIALSTADVIHSFWVPSLTGKMDMIPGRVNRLTLEATRPGVFRGQCAEYCGAQHALMAFYVIAEPEQAFQRWLAHEATPAIEPADPFFQRGLDAFLREGCGACHTIRGTGAKGPHGPDLTHVGNRRSLAAGTLNNHVGTLAGWIADSQRIKPGNLMPSMSVFVGQELRAVAAYLESLK